MKLLFLDVETGGIGLDKSLLSLHCIVTDKDFQEIDSKGWLLKPDDGIYRVDAEALAINRINLISHDGQAIIYKRAAEQLYQFLCNHSIMGKEKLTPVGHGVRMDLFHIADKLLNEKTLFQFVSFRCLDTQAIAQWFRLIGELPEEETGGLESLGRRYCIPIGPDQLHTAKGDTELTASVLFEMVKQYNGKQSCTE